MFRKLNRFPILPRVRDRNAAVAELVDAADLKSVGMKIPWGFESPRRHR